MISAPAATINMDLLKKRGISCVAGNRTAVFGPISWSLYLPSCPDFLHACDSGQGKPILKNRVNNLTCCAGLDSFGCGWPFVRGN